MCRSAMEERGAKPSAEPPNQNNLKEEYEKTTKDQNNNKNNASPLLLLVCASGICGCYLCYGQVQEKMFSKGSGLSEAIQEVGSVATFMLVLSCVTNVVVAKFWISVSNWSSTTSKQVSVVKRPLNHLLLLSNAFTYFAAMTASNEALGYVSYPTAVLAKSSKLIPQMVIGFLLERKSFHADEWFSAALITAGITIFNLSRISPKNEIEDDGGDSLYGLFLLFFSLVMDGLLGFSQGRLKKENNGFRIPTALECMLWVNAYAIVFMLPLSIWSGQWANGMSLLRLDKDNDDQQQLSIGRAITILNASAAAGQMFIFFTIQRFSPLMCTTITTTRKFLTILFSVWSFGHEFTVPQWSAIVMVFGGLYLAIVSKFVVSKKAKAKKLPAPAAKKNV